MEKENVKHKNFHRLASLAYKRYSTDPFLIYFFMITSNVTGFADYYNKVLLFQSTSMFISQNILIIYNLHIDNFQYIF